MTLALWNVPAWNRLVERRRVAALPHALLIGGAAGLGKRAFADAFASALLCTDPRIDGHACGVCRACKLLSVGSHPDLVRVNLELRDDSRGEEKRFRSEITVDQIRALSERFTLTSQFGGAQIVLIDPADAMNVSASNALLKTLEEPTPNTFLVLIADQPARLSATIRSRCQRIDFRIPSASVARDWLTAQGIAAARAQDALDASDGNPGLALDWLRSDALKLRADVAKDLRDLNAGAAASFDVAQRWSREDVDLRLRFAATLAQQQGRPQALAVMSIHERGPLALTAAIDLPKLTAWFNQANRTRDLLRGPLRPELALLELLAAWSAASGTTQSRSDASR